MYKANFFIIISLLLSVSLFAQTFDYSRSNTAPAPVYDVNDYTIIASTSSYIEIEFTPSYAGNSHRFSGENGSERPAGHPDISSKSFPLFLPSPNNNRIEILESQFEEIRNENILPVPIPVKDVNKKTWSFDLKRDESVYTKSEFYPNDLSQMIESGVLRNKYLGYAVINPVQYNPVNKTLRRYTKIRFRVIFTSPPVFNSLSMSLLEQQFLSYAAVNAYTAANWSTVEFNSLTDRSSFPSVLSSGDFYKIEIKETGMYKLDKAFLQNSGLNVDAVNPHTIKLYGNGGAELPYNNGEPAPDDLIENKIFFVGNGDNIFDNGEYFVFYGRAPHEWKYDSVLSSFTHDLNDYSNSNYYFITHGGANGQRMDAVQSGNQQGIPVLDWFWDMRFEEPEVNNLGSTGNIWVSQRIGVNESFNFTNDLKGYVNGSLVNLRTRFGNGTLQNSIDVEVKDENSSFLNVIPISGFFDGFSHIVFNDPNGLSAQYTLNGTSTSRLRLTLLPTTVSSASAYFDFYELVYKRSTFSVEGDYLKVEAPDTAGTFEFNLSTFSSNDVKLFDATDQSNVKIINPASFSNGVLKFQAELADNVTRRYFASGSGSYKTPVSISNKIDNQNIHGISAGASFVIITPPEFLGEANRLKAHRETPGPYAMKTEVINIEHIYNEFSGGLLDPVAVRNFIKFAYNNWSEKPVYVLMFGDGSYDFKNIRNIYNSNLKNWLPSIQKSSLQVNEIESYPSDDFAFDINESHNTPVAVVPDFAAGRVCINSVDDAKNVVDKIIEYESPTSFGIWKKKNMYVADDGWTTVHVQGEEGTLHTEQSERIAEQKTPLDFEKEKVYIVSYPTVITPQGRRKPQANVDIIRGWNEGRLVINYVGHGSTDLWAHEQIFERQQIIPQLNNNKKYPIVTIASCDLARYDDPFSTSAAEDLVNLNSKGAISVIAASRPVYSAQNAVFNEALWSNFMNKRDSTRLPMRLGLAMYNAKFVLQPDDNHAKFILIGDPSLRPAIPHYYTVVDSINNYSGTDTAVIKGLQKVRITGSILRLDSTFWNDFNGDIDLKIFDVDKIVDIVDFTTRFLYRIDGGKIFSGRTSVNNGKWTLEFVVPKDISYTTGRGKMLAYFKNSNTDGSGYNNSFIMSGLDSNAAPDSTGPQITAYLGSRNFRSGDMVNQNTKLIADFYDENGMNLTGTIGHKIEATIDGDENNKIDLTPFYNSTSNYQNGTLEYDLTNLANGQHTLKITGWDTYNNVSSTQIDFIVQDNSVLAVQKVYNYPNPMQDNTSFTFQHNYDQPLNVKIRIYTVSGRMIKEINRDNITDKFVQLDWDGRDDDGDAIANGTYIYRVVINTGDGSVKANTTGKLAKLK